MSAEPEVTGGNIGSRLIPRSLLSSDSSLASLTEALRFIVSQGAILSGLSVNVSRAPSNPNSVNPAWRSAAFSAVFGTYVPRKQTSLSPLSIIDVDLPGRQLL